MPQVRCDKSLVNMTNKVSEIRQLMKYMERLVKVVLLTSRLIFYTQNTGANKKKPKMLLN